MSFVSIIKGLGSDGKAKEIGASGRNKDLLKVVEENSHILKEILVELKAINSHQAIITELEFDGTE